MTAKKLGISLTSQEANDELVCADADSESTRPHISPLWVIPSQLLGEQSDPSPCAFPAWGNTAPKCFLSQRLHLGCCILALTRDYLHEYMLRSLDLFMHAETPSSTAQLHVKALTAFLLLLEFSSKSLCSASSKLLQHFIIAKNMPC